MSQLKPGDRIATTKNTRAPMDQTKGYRDSLLTKTYKPGAIVRVLAPYVGGGMFASDGAEGSYVIVAELPLSYGIGRDYKLAKPDKAGAGHWDIIVNTSRMEPAS